MTIKATTSNAPTICTPSAVATPMSTANRGASNPPGTPRAVATAGSTLENSSGRYTRASTTSTTTAAISNAVRSVGSMATICPTRMPNLFDARPG